MCGKFIALSWDDVLGVIESIEMDTPFIVEPDWPAFCQSVTPRSKVLIIAPGEDGLEPMDLLWGFKASWEKKMTLFNTRLETVLDSKSVFWRDMIEHGRCIVPTFGFYEPSRTEKIVSRRSGKVIKRPYFFTSPGSLTLLAGVHDRDAFSVVTTRPNPSVARIHDRMPLVIRPDEVDLWLSGELTPFTDRSTVILNAQPT